MSVDSAMSRIRATDSSRMTAEDREQQHEMYRKTLEALEDVTPEDEDEGLTVVTDWLVEQLEETGERPSSKAVRRRAREYCRNNGYAIPDDSWLGT